MALLKNGPIKTCKECGDSFQITSARNIYCSELCRKRGHLKTGAVIKERWRKNNKEKISAKHKQDWKRRGRYKHIAKFRVSIADLHKYLNRNDNRCPICWSFIELFSDNVKIRAVIDHDHLTNKFRGVLCSSCNKGIGHFNDIPSDLRRAATYLEQWSKSLE